VQQKPATSTTEQGVDDLNMVMPIQVHAE